MAANYREQNRYADAEPLYRRCITIREKVLGQDNSDTAACIAGLADLYRGQDRYAEAEPLYKRAVIAEERAYGSDSTRVAGTLHNLALLYTSLNRHDDAATHHKRSLDIFVKLLGPQHPTDKLPVFAAFCRSS